MNERMEAPTAGRLVTIDDLHAPVRVELDRVQEELARFFHCEVRLINEIAEHVVLTVGKRMRPTLLLLVAKLGAEAGFAGPPGGAVGAGNGSGGEAVRDPVSHQAIVAATIVELIHTATLVHDDSIDRSYLRRGLPTVNSIWNDQTAVIMGDYLYSKGFHLLVENNLWDVMGILAGTTYRMSIGEMLELEKKRDPSTTEADYLKMIEEKTATLIAAASEIGALLSFGDGPERQHFKQFGLDLGMAFQITDDLLDYEGETLVVGKTTGADIKDGKITLPLIHALRMAPPERAARIREIAAAPEISDAQWTQVQAFAAEFGGLDYCRDLCRHYADAAEAGLTRFGGSPYARTLSASIDYVLHRRR